MSDYDPVEEERHARRSEEHAEWRERGRKAWRHLTTRSAETWLFFAVGIAVGRFIL